MVCLLSGCSLHYMIKAAVSSVMNEVEIKSKEKLSENSFSSSRFATIDDFKKFSFLLETFRCFSDRELICDPNVLLIFSIPFAMVRVMSYGIILIPNNYSFAYFDFSSIFSRNSSPPKTGTSSKVSIKVIVSSLVILSWLFNKWWLRRFKSWVNYDAANVAEVDIKRICFIFIWFLLLIIYFLSTFKLKHWIIANLNWHIMVVTLLIS